MTIVISIVSQHYLEILWNIHGTPGSSQRPLNGNVVGQRDVYIYICLRIHFTPHAVTSSSNTLDTLVWTESPLSRIMGHGFEWDIKMYQVQLHLVVKLNAA